MEDRETQRKRGTEEQRKNIYSSHPSLPLPPPTPTEGEVLPKPSGMTIGRLGLDQFDGFFHGHLDEVTILNSVVDDDQVVRMFHQAVERMNSLKPTEP